MDSAVSPVRVLVGEANGQSSEFWVDGRPPARTVGRLGPVSADSLFVPSKHGVWFDDQKGVASTCPTHCRPKEGEDGSVGVGEVWSVDLALKNEDLVAEGKDLGVTFHPLRATS